MNKVFFLFFLFLNLFNGIIECDKSEIERNKLIKNKSKLFSIYSISGSALFFVGKKRKILQRCFEVVFFKKKSSRFIYSNFFSIVEGSVYLAGLKTLSEGVFCAILEENNNELIETAEYIIPNINYVLEK